MGIVATFDQKQPERISRNFAFLTGTLNFAASGDGGNGQYDTGGVPAGGIMDYFKGLKSLLCEPNSGYNFTYDQSGDRVLLYLSSGTPAISAGVSHNHVFTGTAQAPLLRCEEVQTVSSNTCTLDFAPFYVIAVEVTAGNVTGAFNIIPVGETPATKQVAIGLTTGVCTFLSTDAVTAIRVTYLPLQTTGFHVEANRVVDEDVTAAAAKATLANQACMIQYVYDDTDSNIVTFEPVGEAPSATHICVVDIDAGSSDSNIDSHADDEGNTLKVTYIKYSAYPAVFSRGDGNLGLAAEKYNWVGNSYRIVSIPGLGTQFCGEEAGAGNELGTWTGPSGTVANTVGTWDPRLMQVTTNNTNAIVTLAMPWVYLDPIQVQSDTPAGTNAAEATHTHTATGEAGDQVGDTIDISALTAVRFVAFGIL